MGIVNALLRGEAIDRTLACSITGLRGAGAYQILRSVLESLDGAEAVRGDRGLTVRLRGVRRGETSRDVVVAACLGASLAKLFVGSHYGTAMRRAVQTLAEASPRPRTFANLDRKFLFIPGEGEMALPSNARSLELLVGAILDQHWVRLRYRHFSGAMTSERAQPLSLAIYDHQLYLLCRTGSRAVETRRFSRILGVQLQSERFEYPGAQEYDPDVLFRTSFGILRYDGTIAHVVVRLSPRWTTYVLSHRWHRSQQVERRPDGPRIHLEVRLCDELEAWVLGFGEEAEVLEPEQFRKRISARARSLARVYARRSTDRRGRCP